MPELPEVETVVRGLRESLVGRTITGLTIRWPRSIAFPPLDSFREQVVGRQVLTVGRRGKYVVLELDRGYLLIHLKMSGRLRVVAPEVLPDKHTHTVFDLDDGRHLQFQDTRKFGRVYFVDDVERVTGDLGPEPLAEEFSLEQFQRRLERRSGRLKPLLMNQQFLAGLGNIYADEALFAARLGPLRAANSLACDEQARLYQAIRTVLSAAIASGGTTLDDRGYTDANGDAGAYQERVVVYGRDGQPCPICGSPIERLVLAGRSAHYCPRCQV
jgi:formamidopyrimidine-DNA glycosylase